MLLPPAKKQRTLACIREIQVHNLWTKVYSQNGLTAMVVTRNLQKLVLNLLWTQNISCRLGVLLQIITHLLTWLTCKSLAYSVCLLWLWMITWLVAKSLVALFLQELPGEQIFLYPVISTNIQARCGRNGSAEVIDRNTANIQSQPQTAWVLTCPFYEETGC